MAALTKAEQWRYEQEWRFIDVESAGVERQLPAKSITAVILGWRASSKVEQLIRRWIRESGEVIALRRAIASSTNYNLDIVDVA